MFKNVLIFSLFFFLVGCGNGIALKNSKDELNQTHPQQVRNGSTLQEELDYYEDYVDVRQLQEKKLADNDMENYSDPYITEETQEIAKKLMENKDIITTEVKMINDQVFVAVRLRENVYGRNHGMDIVTTIERQVAEILNDDQIRINVYTDHSQWQQLKNQDAEADSNSLFNDFFNGNE